jgi:hypothetical protein
MPSKTGYEAIGKTKIPCRRDRRSESVRSCDTMRLWTTVFVCSLPDRSRGVSVRGRTTGANNRDVLELSPRRGGGGKPADSGRRRRPSPACVTGAQRFPHCDLSGRRSRARLLQPTRAIGTVACSRYRHVAEQARGLRADHRMSPSASSSRNPPLLNLRSSTLLASRKLAGVAGIRPSICST